MKNINLEAGRKEKKDLVRKAVYWTSNAVLAGVAIPTCATLFALGVPIFVPAGVIAMAFLGNRAVWAVTVKQEDAIRKIDENSKWTREKMEICGKMLQSTVDKTGKAFVQGCKVATRLGQGAYRELGGTEGAKKAIDGMGKVLEEAGKLGIHAVKTTGRAIGEIAQEANKQIEGKSKSRNPKRLEDVAEFVNFVIK